MTNKNNKNFLNVAWPTNSIKNRSEYAKLADRRASRIPSVNDGTKAFDQSINNGKK